jgi:SAM-dependent methyltransferase
MKVVKDLFYQLDRHVPGSIEYSLKAAEIANINELPKGSKVLEAGCAVGTATFMLAGDFSFDVTAVDIDSKSLKILEQKLKEKNLDDKVTLVNKSMLELFYEDATFDLIWTEGALLNVGFYKGILRLGKLLKPGRKIVASELSWIKDNPPDDVFWYWKENYPSMTGIEENIKTMEKAGFTNIKYFVMGKDGFWDKYYKPMLNHINYFKQKTANDVLIQAQLDELEMEVDYFVKYGDYYSYVFYIGEKA